MRKYVQLITTDYLKAQTVIDSNVDDSLSTPAINTAQDINIQSVLGAHLYQKIMDDVYDETITEPYEILLQYYIKPALAEWAVYQLIPYLNWKFTNKNIAERFSDNSTHSDLKIVSYLREDTENKAQYYSQRITEYIINNQSDFPEYFNNPLFCSIKPERNNYNTTIYFPKRFRCWGGPGNSIKIR